MRSKGTTVEDINLRRDVLAKIISDLKVEGVPVTKKILVEKMAKKGYKMDDSTLHRDRTELNKKNTFVRDMGESNYSSYIEEIATTLDYVTNEALAIYEAEWNKVAVNTKTKGGRIVKGRVVGGETVFHERKAEKNALHAKIQALRIINDATKCKLELLKGDTINISVALLGQKLNKLKDEVHDKTNQLNEKDKTIAVLEARLRN